MSGEGVIASQPPVEHRRGVGNRLRRGTVICPVCNADARISGSEHVTALVKTLWCACTNITCGMTWRMQLSFEYVISPSAIEREDIELPQAPADLVRHIFPPGPPGNGPAPDPNQFDMFEDEEGDGGEEADGEPAAA